MYDISNITNGIDPGKCIVSPSDTAGLMREYCSSISSGVGWLILIVMAMWIFAPALKKILLNSTEGSFLKTKVKTIMFFYKWFALGLLSLCLYVIFFMY